MANAQKMTYHQLEKLDPASLLDRFFALEVENQKLREELERLAEIQSSDETTRNSRNNRKPSGSGGVAAARTQSSRGKNNKINRDRDGIKKKSSELHPFQEWLVQKALEWGTEGGFAREMGISESTLSKLKNGKLKNSGEFVLKYNICVRLDLTEAETKEAFALYRNFIKWLHRPSPPPAPVPLLGRDADIELILNKLFAPGFSGVVLHGPLGIGKTQLVLTIARHREIDEKFSDGCVWVPLEEHLKTSDVLIRVREALREVDNPNPLSTILKAKQHLLILDDVWHYEQALCVLKIIGSDSKVIITTHMSHIATHSFDGLTSFEVRELSPEAAFQILERSGVLEESRVPEELRDDFIRARAELLVKKLNCLPIAIVIACDFLQDPEWTIKQLLEDLDQLAEQEVVFDLTGDEEHLPSKTLVDLLAIGYNYLEAKDQADKKDADKESSEAQRAFVYRCLAAFAAQPASFTAAAVAAVCNLPNEGKARYLLRELYHAGVVKYAAQEQTGEWRYSFHRVISLFAKTRLDPIYEEYYARWAHTHYYAEIAEQAMNLYRDSGDAIEQALSMFDQDRLQIDMSWRWVYEQARDPRADELLLHYVDVTTHIAHIRYEPKARISQIEQACAAAKRLIEQARNDAARRLGYVEKLSLLLVNLGNAHLMEGAIGRAFSCFKKADVAFKEASNTAQYTSNPYHRGKILIGLGAAFLAWDKLNNLERIKAYYKEFLALPADRRFDRDTCIVQANSGSVFALQGSLDQALSNYQAALNSAQIQGEQWIELTVLRLLGDLCVQQQCVSEALSHYCESLKIARRLRDKEGAISTGKTVAHLLAALGLTEYVEKMRALCQDIEKELWENEVQPYQCKHSFILDNVRPTENGDQLT